MKDVAILGSGISGLFATWACIDLGIYNVDIITNNNNVPKAIGFQILHNPCNLEIRGYPLREEIEGEVYPIDICDKLYSLKVYGMEDITNSLTVFPDNMTRTSLVCNMDEAINLIQKKISERKITTSIHDVEFNDLIELSCKYKNVFCTIPLPEFTSGCIYKEAYIKSYKTKEKGNHVFYNVDLINPIYRRGCIFGNYFIESTSKLFEDSIKIKKVVEIDHIKINTQLLPSNIHFIGRYAEWNKNVMAHDVFKRAQDTLNG